MSIQVNIFNSGSVPTATELVNFINELNTDLDSIVTLNTEQVIEGVKTFWGSKMLKFKQKATADKLGFTFYDYQGKEVGNFEYDNKNNFRLLALGNYYSNANQEIEGHVGFKVYNKSALAAYRLLCPLAGNAKNSIPSLTDTYTNFYMPLVFTNGAVSVMADNNGKVDLSTLIGSGGGSGDTSDLATVATTGNYNDLLNRPILFSGNYNDLTNKPTLFSGSYGDLTDKPTLFSGDYNDLTNKPTIPTVPTISTNITNDATSNTKTTSPKAVKDFVEGKGYLTQHQDISGKADQTDLEALEDRVETLEQGGSGGGSTTQYSYLKLIPDLDAYTEAPVGEIAMYSGQTDSKYIRGGIYECVTAGGRTIVIPQFAQILDVADSNQNTEFATFMSSAKKPFMHTGETVVFDKYQKAGEGKQYAGYLFPHGQTPQAGDYVYFYSSSLQPHLVLSNNGTNLVIQRTYGKLTLQSQPTVQNSETFYMFANPDNIKLLIHTQNQSSEPKRLAYAVLDYTNNINYDDTNTSGHNPVTVITFYSQSDTITYGSTPEWQSIILPNANNSN